MAFQSSLGVAVEDGGLYIVHLKSGFKKVKVAAEAVYPLDAGKPLEERLNAAGEAFRGFLAEHRVPVRDIHLGVPRDLAFLRIVSLPAAVKENLRQSLAYELDKYSPFPAEDVAFDYQVLSEDKEGGRLQLLLVMMRKASLKPFLALAAQAGKGIASIGISSTALVNALDQLSRDSRRAAEAVLFLENGHLELDYVKDRRLVYSRYVVAEGEEFGEVLERELDLLKEAQGLEKDGLPLLCLGLDSADTRLEKAPPEPGWRHLDPSAFGLSRPGLLRAFGLALGGVGEVPMGLNLLPPELQKKASKIGYYTMFGLLGLLVLAAAAWGGGQLFQKRLIMKRLDAEISRLGTEIAKIQSQEQRLADLEMQIDYVAGLRGKHVPALDVLKELTETIPEDAWVRDLIYAKGRVQIQGYAASASELIPLLEASPFFKDVGFMSRITKSRDGKEQFRIGLQVSPE